MNRPRVYLALLFLSLISASFLIQNNLFKPVSAIEKSKEFALVTSDFCVVSLTNQKATIKVTGGELPSSSIGLLTSEGVKIKQGDCLAGLLQLSPAGDFERFAFHAKLKDVSGRILSDPETKYVNDVRTFLRQMSGDSANLVAGLAVGIDSGLSKDFRENMKTTGLTHLTAVSGANCAIVLALVWLVLRKLRFGRGVRTVLSLLTLSGYVFLVGWQPSVLRSAFMMSCVFVALEFGRRVWLPAALTLGSAILLIIDPWLLFEYGFWLSVLATFGLVVLSAKLVKIFESKMPKWLAIGLAATLAAQLWCLPLIIILQGGLPTHSVVANLLVEPLVPLITVLGVLGALVGPFLPFLGSVLINLASVPSSWIVFVANSLANAPATLLPVQSEPLVIGLVLVAVFALTLAIVKKRFSYLAISAGVISVWFASLIGLGATAAAQILGNWQVFSCDVGQGDATLLRSQGKVALIDVGRDPKPIDDCLWRNQISKIDLLVLTHFDNDHVGGWKGVLKGREVDQVLISGYPDTRDIGKAVVGDFSSNGSTVTVAPKGLTGGVGRFSWEVISALGNAGNTANESSLALRFESDDLILYTLADLNQVAQSKLVDSVYDSDKPTVVKVSHHGSADQDQNFYRKIGADVALISVGAGNSYGHPTTDCLEMLHRVGVNIFRTDLQGSLSLSVSGGAIEVMGSRAR